MNKYLYSYNSPLRYIDPDGHDALLVTNKDTGETTLVIPVHFTGTNATPGLVAEITNRAAQLDIGTSGVKIQVISTDKPINGVLNTSNLSQGLDYKNYWAGEGVNKIGGTRDTLIPTALHEAALLCMKPFILRASEIVIVRTLEIQNEGEERLAPKKGMIKATLWSLAGEQP